MVETEAPVREHSGTTSLEGAHLPTLFRGRGEYAIDDKGRLTLPAQMRRPLVDGGSLVVLDGKVAIWNEPTYRLATDVLNERVAAGDLALAHVRTFIANTHLVAPDAQGRIVVPHTARVEAGLDRDVLVLGVGPRIEIVDAGTDSLDRALGIDDSVVNALDQANF